MHFKNANIYFQHRTINLTYIHIKPIDIQKCLFTPNNYTIPIHSYTKWWQQFNIYRSCTPVGYVVLVYCPLSLQCYPFSYIASYFHCVTEMQYLYCTYTSAVTIEAIQTEVTFINWSIKYNKFTDRVYIYFCFECIHNDNENDLNNARLRYEMLFSDISRMVFRSYFYGNVCAISIDRRQRAHGLNEIWAFWQPFYMAKMCI